MTQSVWDPHDPDVDGHVEWLVYIRDWGTWLEPVTTIEEAMDLFSQCIGGDPIYARYRNSKDS